MCTRVGYLEFPEFPTYSKNLGECLSLYGLPRFDWRFCISETVFVYSGLM